MGIASGLLASLVATIVFAWATRRLPGSRRVSTPATAVAALIGTSAGWAVSEWVDRRDVPSEDA